MIREVEPRAGDDTSLLGFVSATTQQISDWLHVDGIIRFRNFSHTTLQDLEEVARIVGGPTLDYEFRSNQRTRLSGNVFSSTDIPPEETIPFHNEMSYFSRWPAQLWFQCITPAATGGRTLFAESSAVFDQIPGKIRERFKGGVRYVRNFNSNLDISWQEAFGSDDPVTVEKYCLQNGLEFEWTDGGLSTSQWRPAIVREMRSNQWIWFNQAHLFHPSSLGEREESLLIRAFGDQGVPRTVTYADGSQIERDDLDTIRGAYARTSFPIEWRRGEVVVFDNVRFAHSRESFTPPRKLVVTMAGDGTEKVVF